MAGHAKFQTFELKVILRGSCECFQVFLDRHLDCMCDLWKIQVFVCVLSPWPALCVSEDPCIRSLLHFLLCILFSKSKRCWHYILLLLLALSVFQICILPLNAAYLSLSLPKDSICLLVVYEMAFPWPAFRWDTPTSSTLRKIPAH